MSRWLLPRLVLPVWVVLVVGCSDDGRDLRPPPGFVDGRLITIDLLSSPETAVVELLGSGAVASDPVTVDGRRADVLSFIEETDGRFRLRVAIGEGGARTVCVADVCGEVFTAAPPAG